MNPIRGIRPSAPVSRTQQDLQGASTSRDHNDGGQGTAASFEYPEQWEGASEAEAEEEEEEGEQEEEDAEGDSGDEDEATSDTSSAMFDPEADPEGWAIRQDELAGVLEMGEEEARAIRWGSDMSKLDSGTSISRQCQRREVDNIFRASSTPGRLQNTTESSSRNDRVALRKSRRHVSGSLWTLRNGSG